jgi:PAS domain S-box-containing protein
MTTNLSLPNIKNKLVDIALLVAAIAALPLLAVSLYRAFTQNIPIFFFTHTSAYLMLLAINYFKKRIAYKAKAFTISALMYLLALADLSQTGFVSASIIWLLSFIIITALLFDIKQSLIAIVVAVISYVGFYIFYINGIVQYKTDLNLHGFSPLTIAMHVLMIILIGLMIGLSYKHIQQNLIKSISGLNAQKTDLENTALKLKTEISIRKKSESLAINNEKNFRNIFEKSSDAILIIDNIGKIKDFNPAFLQLSGNTENELSNTDCSQLALFAEAGLLKNLGKGTEALPDRFEIKYKNQKSEEKILDCSTSSINYNEKSSILLIIRDYTEHRNKEKTNYLSALKAEEKERARLSKELHDGLGPLLSTLKIYLDIFYTNPTDDEVKHRIENTLNESIKTVKEVSNNLSPYILDNLGLTKAIESFIEKIRFGQNIQIEYKSDLDYRIDNEIEISIYRFISELFNNTIKHAKAGFIKLEILKNFNNLDIIYSDNGVGFNYDENNPTDKGIGLFNLKGRIEKLGGKVKIKTSPGKGFLITANLPV